MNKWCIALAALSLSTSIFAADLSQARTLVEQQRYAEAISIYNALLVEQPGQADLLIEAARVNAWADQNQAAAALYQRALDTAPGRRYDILLPLAWQLAWSGNQAAAIPFFREVATQAPSQTQEAQHGLAETLASSGQTTEALAVYETLAHHPEDLKARQGEARMLLWLGRNDEAVDHYRAILVAHPNDPDAQIGLARGLNNSGRHFAAVNAYNIAVAHHPSLATDTRGERATALRWAGLDDVAWRTLENANPTDTSTQRNLLKREMSPSLRAEIETSWDSDKLDIHALSVGWQQPSPPSYTLDVSARAARIEQNDHRIDGHQLLFKTGTRIGSIDKGLLWPSLTVGMRNYDGWQTPVWKLQGKWLPADFWRIDLEAGNDVIENIDAINNRVTLNALSASADWRFTSKWKATVGGTVLRFDDNNQRTRLIGRIEHTLISAQPKITLGLEGMGFNDSDPTIARGYYNPERYRELKLQVRAEHQAAGWQLEARLAVGQLWETPGDSSGLYAWELSAAHDLPSQLRLRLYAGGSDSSAFLRTGSGYTRNYLGASLIWLY